MKKNTNNLEKVLGETILFTCQQLNSSKICQKLDLEEADNELCLYVEILFSLKYNNSLDKIHLSYIQELIKNDNKISRFFYKLWKYRGILEYDEQANHNEWELLYIACNLLYSKTNVAVNLLKKALIMHNDFAPVLYLLGMKIYGSYTYAEKSNYYFNKIKSKFISEFFQEMKFVKLSNNYLYLFNEEKALIYAKEAVSLNSIGYTFSNLGYVYHGFKYFNEALINYQKALDIYKFNRYKNLLAWLYLDIGEYKKAEKLFIEISKDAKDITGFLPIFRYLVIMNKKDKLSRFINLSIEKFGLNKYNEAYKTFLCKNVECLTKTHIYYEKKYQLDKWLTEIETRLILLNQNRIFNLPIDFNWDWTYEMYIRKIYYEQPPKGKNALYYF